MSVLVVHPLLYARQTLRRILRSELSSIVKERAWDLNTVEEANSIAEAKVSSKVSLILCHFSQVAPNTVELDRIRELRIGGVCAPILGLTYSGRTPHKVFAEEAHALLVCPFRLDQLRDALRLIRPIPSEMALRGFVARVFADLNYLNFLLNDIGHAVKDKDWDRVTLNISRINIYFKEKTSVGTRELEVLLAQRESSYSNWRGALDRLTAEASCRNES